ncbi:DUF3034 family protein [Sphingomonas adhaesiva]|uniref:DUF3034 family protein n=1 Tax=Sphingomonas adhaesiva TaxID=28212 RepID=UPI002FF7127B
MIRWFLFAAALAGAAPAMANDGRSGGKLVLTDGVGTVEGSAGGGLATWAVIAGNETDRGVGGTAAATLVALPDFTLKTVGGSLGFYDRVEISYAHQAFDTRAAGATLGLGRNFTFKQDVFGAKLRVAGDAVWAQDRVLPQIAIGVQHKRADQRAVIAAVGGRASAGTDVYVSATKLILSQGLLLDATLRMTRANQFGLLGHGGDRGNAYGAQFEGSVGKLLSPRLVVGAEYRSKPDRLGFAREDDTFDVFAAWAVQRNLTLTAAYVDLGSIATVRGQRGLFVQVQGGF